jgi:HlyD family secretion protein
MRSVLGLTLFATAAFALAGCAPDKPVGWQGYLEGEFVHVAAPLGGRLEQLSVAKGATVAAGAPLFTLEHAAETAAQAQAAAQLRAAQARLADLGKGARPPELAALEARLAQARSLAELSALELGRATSLHDKNILADGDFDRARLAHEANLKLTTELDAQLATAQLGARADTVAAAEAEVAAAQAALARADWSVAQKTQAAPRAGLVQDTLYREGETVAPAAPVVTLLPPENIKARFFVPQESLAALQAGGPVLVNVPGRPAPLTARISFISPGPEYTPPVLYNRENRAKLVFMVEAVFPDPAVARELHPGQPVDVLPAN